MDKDSADVRVERLRITIARAIADPGATEGYKNDRSLTEWQTDAVMRALAASDLLATPSSAPAVAFSADDLAFMRQKVAADCLVYMGHYAAGALQPCEIERMHWLNSLSDKLDAAIRANGGED